LSKQSVPSTQFNYRTLPFVIIRRASHDNEKKQKPWPVDYDVHSQYRYIWMSHSDYGFGSNVHKQHINSHVLPSNFVNHTERRLMLQHKISWTSDDDSV